MLESPDYFFRMREIGRLRQTSLRVCLCVCVCVCVCGVCVCVYVYFRATGNEADDERYLRLQC